MKLDVFGDRAFVANHDVDAERGAHRLDNVVDAYRRAGGEVHGQLRARRLDQREKPIHRIVDIHEVDQVLAVAANHEFALAVGQRPEPTRRDPPRRLVRTRRSAKNRRYCSEASFEIAYGKRGETDDAGETAPLSPSYTAPDER